MNEGIIGSPSCISGNIVISKLCAAATVLVMEWKSNLRRTQSLSGPLSCDQPTWTKAGLQDRQTASVSQLVARYQTTVEVTANIQKTVNNNEAKRKHVLKEITPSLVETEQTCLEALLRRNDEKERSRARINLARSRSVGSLQNSVGTIEALKALFESKAVAQNKTKGSVRAPSLRSSCKEEDITQTMNEAKSPAEKPTTQVPAVAPVNDVNEDNVTEKVVNQTWLERRKTIGGIDFENTAASQADEKRRSIADFRDSSFIQTKEKLCVSVKAISALYLSKVAPQESTNSILKLTQDHSFEPRERVKLSKMAEEEKVQKKCNLPPPPSTRNEPGTDDISGAHFQQSMPSQLSKEKLHHQRQKCELRRLLKHTHPELKMLDDVVDDELAEVLSTETGVTTGETGYEGEVLSRCLLFENCALSDKVSPYTPQRHMAERTVERGNVGKSSAVFEGHDEKPCGESVKGIVEDAKTLGSSPDPNTEGEEEIRIDVQATRRMFESQSVFGCTKLNPDNKFQGKISVCGDEAGAVQKRKQECSKVNLHSKNKSSACTKSLDLTDQEQGPSVHSTNHKLSGREEIFTAETVFEDELTTLPDPKRFGEVIKTSVTLFKNNPFIQTKIEKEQSFVHTSKSYKPVGDGMPAQDCLITNVKNRAHLFESMPFDKIRQQNQDELETMVENIKKTLNCLHHINAIHSGGSIIEVNETMIAKKAKFTLSEGGPLINYSEVAEGGAQNFILQLLPRANLKPQITYLKENSKGSMETIMVNVPVHQHQFTTNQDTEFKTANVVQVVEDILNQDNSLRKGVIIQEDVDRCAEVIVYSLYNYADLEDVKRYCPQISQYDDPEPKKGDVSKTHDEELQKGGTESTRNYLLETSKDQTCQESIRPEITTKGNVKLFKSCIERGDMEYLKSLQAQPTVQEQELSTDQNVAGQDKDLHREQTGDQTEESTSEWVPVDVQRLRNMFSGDHRPSQPRQNVCENLFQTATISCASSGQNVPLGKSQSSTEFKVGVFCYGQPNNSFTYCDAQTQKEACNSAVVPQGSYQHLDSQDDDKVHQAELVEVIDDDEISDLQIAIHSLQQATIEAKTLHQSSQEKQKFLAQQSAKETVVSVTTGNVKHSRTKAELPQENEDQKDDPCTEPVWDEFSSASSITSEHELDHQHENTEICRKDTKSEKVQTTETCSKMDQKCTEVVQKSVMVSVHSSETTTAQQEDEEVALQGKFQEALNSLERSNVNVTRGDFRAAMIYRNSSKPHKERSENVDVECLEKSTNDVFCPVTEPKSAQELLNQEVTKLTAANSDLPNQSETLNKVSTRSTSAVLEKGRKSVGPKPAIPPKPEHLKVKQKDIQSTNAKNPEITQTNYIRPKEAVPQSFPVVQVHKQDLFKINNSVNSRSDLVDLQRSELSDDAVPVSQETEVRPQAQGSVITLVCNNTDENIINQHQEKNVIAHEKNPQDFSVKEKTNETDESHVDFHEECKKFVGKKTLSMKNAPVKPKRVKIAQSDNKKTDHASVDSNSSILTHVIEEPQQSLSGQSCNDPNICGQTADNKDKVEMRAKKGRTETEDERRQRLSVHMDEIIRGNITAAMEIFDNLRKQEELQSILSRVEEIEQDTSEVDVGSLRRVFENVPDWVVSSDKKKQKKVEVENKEERIPLIRDNTKSKSSMAHVFGDLERASEEIINLKEQTLARLMDIEGAIKKALYSVSTLKSDSDIAGLSCLFKESLGSVEGSPSSGNISKISIGSSKTKSLPTQVICTPQENKALSVSQSASIETASAKQRTSPPSSPAFISIQSAARKTNKTEVPPPENKVCPTCQHGPKTEEKFRTTKTLTCNSPAQNRKRDPKKGSQKQSSYNQMNPKRELSVFEVQTDHEGNNIMGTKTVTENYERTDNFGNRFYSSTTSTFFTAQPELTASTGQALVSPATYQVTKYPEVQLPINQKP
uniref:LIM domain-containing protein isoform X1 n=1 Tax=Scatophagus argus TaxID=75038 RepID=UPI001ED81892|nr:LIM domain-containing protein isoform X1 [Scatophagus argus]